MSLAMLSLGGARPVYCDGCGAELGGEFCHACGAPRVAPSYTLQVLLGEVRRRVFRLDAAFATTLWRMLHAPGQLIRGFLSGQRKGILDPLQYFITCIFIELLATSATRVAAPALDRLSALNWLGRLSSVVAVKILFVFWMGSFWRLVFRSTRFDLGALYSFTIYALGTTDILWLALPLIDLLVPVPLGANALIVVSIMIGVQIVYFTFAFSLFASVSLWSALWRVTAITALTYLLPVYLLGVERSLHLLATPLNN